MLTSSISNAADRPDLATPFAHLDTPHRMARVIERRRHLIDGTVTERDFLSEPETCHLTVDELRAHIGKAQIIVHQGAAELAYDREARIIAGATIILGLMPAIPTCHTALREAGFPNSELGALWDEIVAQAADRFHVDRAPLKPTGAVGLPNWGRQMLEENAN